jgi:predicted ArsR family transcriptional regulator
MATKTASRSRKRPAPGAPQLTANVAELRALAHPLRLRILELFAEAPRTTKQVSELLGQPPTRLYHHVAALERAGLLKLRETRKNRGAVEKWYETPGRTFGTTAKRGGTRGPDSAARRAVAMTVLDQTRREVVSALARDAAEKPLLARMVLSADPRRMPAIRKRISEMIASLQRELECEPDGEPVMDGHDRWAVTLAFAPVWPRAR